MIVKGSFPKSFLAFFSTFGCWLLEPHPAMAEIIRKSKVSAKVHERVKAKGMRPKREESGQFTKK